MDKTDQTKQTTFQDKTDHVPGQNGPGLRTKRTKFLDKTGPVLGQTGHVRKSMMFYKGLKRAVSTYKHTCDISRFRRELPIWSLSSRSHAWETKPPDERFFQCHFSRTVFQSEHFIVYGSICLANNLFTAQKCLTFIDLIDDH